jgi:hypothetical protein
MKPPEVSLEKRHLNLVTPNGLEGGWRPCLRAAPVLCFARPAMFTHSAELRASSKHPMVSHPQTATRKLKAYPSGACPTLVKIYPFLAKRSQ